MIRMQRREERVATDADAARRCLGCLQPIREGHPVIVLSTGALCCSESCVEVEQDRQADLQWGG